MAVGLGYYWSWLNSVKELETRMSQAAIPVSWQQVRKEVVGDRPLCFSGQCGRTTVKWLVRSDTSEEELNKLFSGVLGQDVRFSGKCGLDLAERSCLGDVTTSDYHLQITLEEPIEGNAAAALISAGLQSF